MPLDDVDEENGCIHLLPGYHTQPTLHHGSAPAVRMLEIRENIDLARVASSSLSLNARDPK
jgi:hypothetical protein